MTIAGLLSGQRRFLPPPPPPPPSPPLPPPSSVTSEFIPRYLLAPTRFYSRFFFFSLSPHRYRMISELVSCANSSDKLRLNKFLSLP